LEELRYRVAIILRKTRDSGGRAPDDRYSVAQLLQDWLDGPLKRDIRASTWTGYEVMVRRHIVPTIGRIRVSRLQPSDVEMVIDRVAEKGLSDRMVQYAHAVLRSALQEAWRQEIVPRNVAKMVRPPRVDPEPVKPVTADE